MKSIAAILFLLFLSCTKQDDCPKYFQIPFGLSPINKEYHVGDTLSVISKFSQQVRAFNSEQKEIGTFDMKGILWMPISFIYRIDTTEIINNPEYSFFITYFEYIQHPDMNYDVIQYSESGNGLIGEYRYLSDTFCLSYKFVCKKPGIFLLENGANIFAGHGSQQDFPGRCGKDGFDVWVQMNEGVNNHIDLLKESPDPHWNTWLVQQEKDNKLFSELGGYCFKVIP